MSTNVNLTLTKAQYEDLHEVSDSRAKTVRVDREALAHLLVDHAVMVRALHASSSFKVVEPPLRRERLKIKN